jgi:hypothetical protein
MDCEIVPRPIRLAPESGGIAPAIPEARMIRTTCGSARLLCALALLIALAGCGTSPTGPVNTAAQANADDVAQLVGASMAQDNGGMVSTYGATPASVDGARARPARFAERLAAAASDTTFTVGAITFTFTRQYLSEFHNGMATFDPVLTWGIVETSRATGSISGPQFDASIGRAGSLLLWNVSVVAPDTMLVDGTANDTIQCSFVSATTGAQRYFYAEMAGALSGVRVPKPVTANYPASGTASWTVSADRLRSNSRVDVQAHFAATVIVTFNGTRTPDVVVNGVYRYHVDLKTGAIQRA